MRRSIAALVIVALAATAGLSAAARKFGKPLTLKDTTKISDIYATPDNFNGKRVKVQGPIVDVCAERGCWIAIGSDQEFQTLRFKVDDGVIVFPMEIRGRTAVVEGVLTVTTLSVADQIEQGEHMAKEKKITFDPKTVKGPKTSIMIKGEGAEIIE
jgi:hypothetical protein